MENEKLESMGEEKLNPDNIVVFVFVALIFVAFFGFLYLQSRSEPATITTSRDTLTSSSSKETTKPQATNTKMETELKIEDLVVGTGDEAVSGKKVTVHYSGTLVDGTKFDSSYDRSTPFSFSLGAGEVIKGWDQGVSGMKVGGKRKLTIPSNLGYGERGVGAIIPPNATLVFEVELLKVE